MQELHEMELTGSMKVESLAMDLPGKKGAEQIILITNEGRLVGDSFLWNNHVYIPTNVPDTWKCVGRKKLFSFKKKPVKKATDDKIVVTKEELQKEQIPTDAPVIQPKKPEPVIAPVPKMEAKLPAKINLAALLHIYSGMKLMGYDEDISRDYTLKIYESSPEMKK